ncbi:hypothetical protein G5I_08862 [Acromyrmex echinatior]|uniref:Uncharacterized protein n=1 Tax=Acromyrmex echinatior TaxID=103372 RepID=F4WSM9_ACREC|nr:hypothetical protein G5I_08862 [Acromyrmex echinatior]
MDRILKQIHGSYRSAIIFSRSFRFHRKAKRSLCSRRLIVREGDVRSDVVIVVCWIEVSSSSSSGSGSRVRRSVVSGMSDIKIPQTLHSTYQDSYYAGLCLPFYF